MAQKVPWFIAFGKDVLCLQSVILINLKTDTLGVLLSVIGYLINQQPFVAKIGPVESKPGVQAVCVPANLHVLMMHSYRIPRTYSRAAVRED